MKPFPVTRIAHIQTTHDCPAWLVDNLWTDQAVGFIGGTPKSCKTWLALELAVAVASGLPCLGRFPVRQQGHVLMYAAEDSAETIKHRAAGIAKIRGIDDFERLALGLITEPCLRLDHTEHQQRLAATLDRLKPRLLVLDPLVRLHHSDENSAGDIAFLRDGLRQLQRRHAVAIILVHHVRKAATDQPGQALRGSGDLHAWSDSNLYLLRQKGRLVLHAEHRALPSPAPVTVELQTAPQPHLQLLGDVLNEEDSLPSRDLAPRILAVLAKQPLPRTALRQRLGVRNERLGETLAALEAAGQLVRHDGLLAVPVPGPLRRPGNGTGNAGQ